jgi:hypothetical protein
VGYLLSMTTLTTRPLQPLLSFKAFGAQTASFSSMSRDSRSRTNGNTVRRAPSVGTWASLRVATRASVSK